MRNLTNWGKLGLLSMVLVFTGASADHHEGHKGWMGNITTGFTTGFGGGNTNGSQFLVDSVHMKKMFKVSDHTNVVVHNAMAVNDGNAAFFGRSLNEAGYFSAATIGAGNFRFSNLAAYVDWACGDGLNVKIGHMANHLGMESIHGRAAMHGYYYSGAYNAGFALGWNYKLGLGLTYHSDSFGTVNWNVFQNPLNFNTAGIASTDTTLGTSLNWHTTIDGGDWSLMPVVSGYFGRFSGGPEDLGLTAGANYKMGTLWANLEMVYVSTAPTPNGVKNTVYSIYLEPGFDLGMFAVSLKPEYFKNDTAGTKDINISAAISKSWGKSWMKLTYLHTGSQGATTDSTGTVLGANGNDVRVLFGTEW